MLQAKQFQEASTKVSYLNKSHANQSFKKNPNYVDANFVK
jgi:hypothetical protein